MNSDYILTIMLFCTDMLSLLLYFFRSFVKFVSSIRPLEIAVVGPCGELKKQNSKLSYQCEAHNILFSHSIVSIKPLSIST